MQEIVVHLRISAEEYLKLYQGRARVVRTLALDGRSVHFPADILKPFITHQGVYGSFGISFDEQGIFQSIRKLEKT